LWVEPDPAITLDELGQGMFQPNGLPVETGREERGLVSDHAVHENNTQWAQHRNPFSLPNAVLVPRDELRPYGVFGRPSYHARGPQIRPVLPNQPLTKTDSPALTVLQSGESYRHHRRAASLTRRRATLSGLLSTKGEVQKGCRRRTLSKRRRLETCCSVSVRPLGFFLEGDALCTGKHLTGTWS